MKGSDPALVMEASQTGTANRFGVYQPVAGTAITMTDPGEFRVDITANYTDPDGILVGAETWGNVVERRPRGSWPTVVAGWTTRAIQSTTCRRGS